MDIDCSYGEGGGQILRTAVSLSAVTRQPIRLTKIRSGRPKPGLQRQHVCAVEALSKLSGSRTEGVQVASLELNFIPPDIPLSPLGKEHSFDVGSAGSATLVLQTILPFLLTTPIPSSHSTQSVVTTKITVTGGTSNPLAPPAQFFRDTFLPCLNRACYNDYCYRREENRRKSPVSSSSSYCRNLLISSTLVIDRHGFFPAGGDAGRQLVCHRG